jgi:hypothetical protein
MQPSAFRRIVLAGCLGLALGAQPAAAALKASFAGTITSYVYSDNGNSNGFMAPMAFVASFVYDLSKGISDIQPNSVFYFDYSGGALADRMIFSSNISFNSRLIPFNTVDTTIASSINNFGTETVFGVEDSRRQGPVYVIENYLYPILLTNGPLIDFSQPGQFTGTGSGAFDRVTNFSINDTVVRTIVEQGVFGGPMTLTITEYVPEPASWMMMIIGFGITGAAMRRSRVAVAA